MKTIIAALLLTIHPLLATPVFRYEFTPNLPDAGGDIFGTIDFLRPNGEDLPVLESIFNFQGRGDNARGFGLLPDIIAPVITSLEGFSVFGSMTWDEVSLRGFWGLQAPARTDNEGAFLALYRFNSDTIDSGWPLEYFPNESSLGGQWLFAGEHQVPDTGSTLVMLGIGIAGLLTWRSREIAAVP